MFILGLTGSIGMGKTVAASEFRRLRVPVHDADKTVHTLMAKGGEAVGAIEKAFPGTVESGAVERKILAEQVFANKEDLSRLEAIIHPLVHRIEWKFLRSAALRKHPLAVLEIPLLFETGGETKCDAVVVVTAARFIQEKRVLDRPGMTLKRFEQICANQLSDAEKRRHADFVVQTGLGRAFSLCKIREIIKTTRNWRGAKWPWFFLDL
ncbi:MAG: dephospho-CoA kinase [Rhodospirillales bacterium]